MKKLGFLKRFMPCLALCLSIMAGMGLFVMHSYAIPMIQAGVISGVYDDEKEIKENESDVDNTESDIDLISDTDEEEPIPRDPNVADDREFTYMQYAREDTRISVLILSSYSMRDTIVEPEIQGINNILSESSYNLSFEFMDSRRYDSEEDIRIYYSYLSNKLLSGKKYDCIISLDDAALSFLLDHDELIDGVPVVYMGIQDDANIEAAKEYDNVTGITENYDFEGNVKAIHNMLPKVKKFYVVTDNSYIGRLDQAEFIELEKEYSEFEWIFVNISETDMTIACELLKNLSSDSVVILSDAYETSDGMVNSFLYNALILTQSSSVPVFCFAYDLTEKGVAGGIVYDSVKAGEMAAIMAMQIINGRDPRDITVIDKTPTIPVYDKDILDRYGIKTSSLPKWSTIRNAPLSFAEFMKEYHNIIIPCIVIIVVIFLEIILQSRRRQRFLSRDYLTGLPNRGYLDDKMRGISAGKDHYGFILVDIDDFRSINDLYGNNAGDKVIVETASRLKASASKDSIIGRLGGDEFIILLKESSVDNIEEYCRSIIRSFDEPVTLDSQSFAVNVTVGAALRTPSMDSLSAFNNASEALRYAKDKLRHNYYFFNQDLGKAQVRRREIKATIEEALSDDGFEIFYQPQFITGTDKLFGMEALVRLKNNIAGPGEFIPVAEENMSIIKIDRVVTHKTIKQMGEWLGKGYNVPPVSINFSNLQLSDRGYPNYVFEKLSSYNIDPSYIVIEITESSFLTTSSATTDYFNQFTEGGIRLSIDDYGTGYSSLSYLNRLPFSCLKIDQSLIRTEPTKENLFMIEKIVEIAHSRHYKVVAEGVETSQQEEFLKSIGCDATQGFMRGKPMRAEDIEKILART
ncbi:MAG: EAL domain-containing protein [Butyrivibrio sp.]|jgi:diguanylate cyclase (GGDEF)-like protein|nr:ABC transporter substrate binding protein [Butyrivibrio sp.]MCR4635296.1 EAL domain-containing protein [Butyrivibrio sp.]